jgi:cobalt-zinc-cadmium efflux system membrane fusion protein
MKTRNQSLKFRLITQLITASLISLFAMGVCWANADTGKPATETKQSPKVTKHEENGEEAHDHGDKDDHEHEKDDHEHDKDEKEHEHGEDEHGHEEGKVTLSNEQQRNAGIQLAKAGPIAIRQTLPLYGVITPSADGIQQVTARFPGVIRQLARKPGDRVTAGDVLATIESNESLKVYSVTATINGVITDRQGAVGEQTSDAPLFTITDTSTVWVDLTLFPRDITRIKSGQVVRVVQPQRGLSGEGAVIYIGTHANPVNQSITARASVDNADGQWFAGHFVSAEVTLAETKVAVAVHNEALQTLEGKTVVFVREADGFEPRPIQSGRADSRYTEIISGLVAGDVYVSMNSFILKSDLGKESAEHEH